MAAVRISPTDLELLCQKTGVPRNTLESIAVPNAADPPTDPFDVHQIVHQPLLHLQNDLVVLAPHRLAEALVNRVLSLSLTTGDSSALAKAVHELQVLEVSRNMESLGLRRLSSVLQPWVRSQETLVSHSFFQCDIDKAIHVAVASPGLALSPTEANLRWNSPTLNEELQLSREAAPRWLRETSPFITHWLSLVVFGSFGLESTVLVAQPKSNEADILTFFASDLEAIAAAGTEHRSPLVFWKYSRSVRDLESRGRIWSTAPIDQFAAWWMRSRSFWATYDVVTIECGLGRILREEAAKRLDWHAVRSWNRDGTIEVCNADGSTFPILLPRNMDPDRLRIAVELPRITIWVLAAENLGGEGKDRRNWFDLGKMIAYWFCESIELLDEHFSSLGDRCDGVVAVEFRVLSGDASPPSELGFSIDTKTPSSLSLTFHPLFLRRYDNTNACEREFVDALIRAVLALPGSSSAPCDSLPEFIDKIAPLGVKRMVHAINTADRPEFIGAEHLPSPCFPDPADRIWVQRHIVQKAPLPGDQCRGPQSRTWLNSAVKAAYDDLRSMLGHFDPRELRHRLMLNNESLINEEEEARLTMPSHLMCYRSAESMTKRLLEEGPRRASAMLATRFLVEHVIAEPPEGAQHLSDAEFDEMLAVGSEIIKMGIASDVAHFNLADVTVTLENGDLAIDGGTYDEATHGAHLAFTREVVDREQSRSTVGRRSPRPSNARDGQDISTLDVVCQDEFGVRLSDLAKIIGDLLQIAHDRNNPVVTAPEEWLCRTLCGSLSFERPAVESAIDLLTLSSRDAFLQPPPGFVSGDIWPWRFNRNLSYVRRPLLRTKNADGSTDLSFTPGHLYRSSKNLVDLVTTGRLKAHSTALRNAMGAFTTLAGKEFNDAVAEALRERGFVVRTQVAKMGKEKLVDAKGNTLGDIDVLCMDTKRRRLVGMECKDFSMARLPNEIVTDMNALFVSSKNSRCFQEKHLARLDWLRSHLDRVGPWLEEATGEVGGQWSVDGALVFSVPLIAPLLVKSKLPVWTLHELRDGQGP